MNRRFALGAVQLLEAYGELAESLCQGRVPMPAAALPEVAMEHTNRSQWGLDYGCWDVYHGHLERLARSIAAQGAFALHSELEETLAFVPDARRCMVTNAHLDSVWIGAIFAPRIMAIDDIGRIVVAPYSEDGARWSEELHGLARRFLRLRETFEALPRRYRRRYGM